MSSLELKSVIMNEWVSLYLTCICSLLIRAVSWLWDGASAGGLCGPHYHVLTRPCCDRVFPATSYMSCPDLEVAISPGSLVSFSREWDFKITAWVLDILIGTGWRCV